MHTDVVYADRSTLLAPAEVGFQAQCSVNGCCTPKAIRGWCRKHYGRWQRTGHPLGLRRVHKTLTRQEMQVLKHLATGVHCVKIARLMNLDHRTVSTYRVRLLLKLNLASDAALAVYAYREGITTWPL